MSQLNTALLELFRAHGVEAELRGEWVILPGRNLKATASIVDEQKQPFGMSVQLDVRLEISRGRTIVESFAGMGATRQAAANDAMQNFTVNSFHVLLGAFLRPDDDQVAHEDWTVGGMEARVTIGNVGMRGTPPVQAAELVGLYATFEEKLKQKRFVPGINWVRLYYAQMDNKTMLCEVLLNNHVWEEIQAEMAAIDLPRGEKFYSMRIFLVIDVMNTGTLTPEDTVSRLAEMVASLREVDQSEMMDGLVAAGVTDKLAGRAYNFTQIAWGRELLSSMGVQFSPEYVCMDASGNIVESGKLVDEPYFAAAARLAPRFAKAPGFAQLAMRSADAQSANELLNGGSKPGDLVTGPAFVFLEAATEAGMENARQALQKCFAAVPGNAAAESAEGPKLKAKKPWWRFWG